MADLQVCYFCGTGPDSSLGEYAVVPPALDPADDHQRSVVLCRDCREKLTTVMEPVVDAAEAYAASERGASAGADAGASTARGGADEAGGTGSDGPGRTDPGTVDAAGEGAGGQPPDGGDTDAPGDSDTAISDADAAAAGAGEGDRSSSPTADTDVGSDVGDEDGGAAGETGGGGDAGTTVDESGAPGDAADASTEGQPGGSGPPRDQPHTDDELVGRNNEAYNRTLRLLQNREFPVERHEIEQVVANAYQLDPQEVSDAIDALISKGLLSQEGAQLVRP